MYASAPIYINQTFEHIKPNSRYIIGTLGELTSQTIYWSTLKIWKIAYLSLLSSRCQNGAVRISYKLHSQIQIWRFHSCKLSAERSYISVLRVFYNSKKLNCIGALSYDSKRSIDFLMFFLYLQGCKLSGAILRWFWFFTIQRIWIVLGRCLFLRSVHTFLWFLKSNWNSDFGHAETGNGAKKRVVLRRDIFSL